MKGRLVFAASLAGTAGIVYLVHSNQTAERQRMYEGVLRDMERQKRKQEAKEARRAVEEQS